MYTWRTGPEFQKDWGFSLKKVGCYQACILRRFKQVAL